MSESQGPTFGIGLVMASAVFAGAYTGSVVDVFMEALETRHRRKAAGDLYAPTHRVPIRVLTGTSAGAIAAAVFGSTLQGG